MKTVYIFLAEGFEEMEAVTPLDLLRRVGVNAKFVSIGSSLQVNGAHNICYTADIFFDEAAANKAHGIVLPGGMPGTLNLLAHQGLCSLIQSYNEEQKPICAICAAPLILGELNLLKGKVATIYPGMENKLLGAVPSKNQVCVDGNIITSRGPGTAIPFALKLVEIFAGKEAAEKLTADIVYQI